MKRLKEILTHYEKYDKKRYDSKLIEDARNKNTQQRKRDLVIMIKWQQLVDVLGKSENSSEFYTLKNEIGENPEISEDFIEYDDPDRTKYYEFFQTGMLIGFRKKYLNHIQFFCKEKDNYSIYYGKLLNGIDFQYTEKMVIELLGKPLKVGGNVQSPFLGYVNRWILYHMTHYSLHFEFNKNGTLCLITLAVLIR
ncbi:hypothetical protein [Gilliamella apis]|uniref:hypothetical protein n=1 Tax=Gilliamella apis TaxID=1970738 RepID=UPI001055E82D|nr:hypothetical protein [Gilliamella apis]